jgi:hypothetical protein
LTGCIAEVGNSGETSASKGEETCHKVQNGILPLQGVEAVSRAITRLASRYQRTITLRRITMSVGTIVLIIVVLLLLGAIPTWPYSRSWGYGPSGGLGLVLVVVLILLLLGRI